MTAPFEGYRRDDASAATLLAALAAAMKRYPNQRLGQLIVNACSPPGIRGHLRSDGAGGDTDLFQLYDEDLCSRLTTYAEEPHAE